MLRVLAPALALAPNLAVLIHFMGEAGLRLGPGRRTRFDIEGYQKTFEGPLNQWAARLLPKPARVDRLLIEFVTPFAHEEKVQDPYQGPVKAALASGPFPLVKALGNTANSLVLWNNQDQSTGPLSLEQKNAT